LASTTQNVNTAVAPQLPSVPSMKRTVQRTRNRDNAVPPNPKTLEELTIPAEYRQTSSGDLFLQYDSGATNNRILVFSTTRKINFLKECEDWYVDGTFSSAPQLFLQLYTIHGLKYGHVIPVIYGLPPNKAESTLFFKGCQGFMLAEISKVNNDGF
jgi:hypothetical protein